jgi:RNA polymerase sigma-70 factor, ECF subfamily
MAITTSAHDILRNVKVDFRQDIPPQYWETIERYREDLVNQARAILGSLEDAEDVVQETFCEAFRDGEKLAQVRSIGAWLRTVNRCNALNRLRDRRRENDNNDRKNEQAPDRTFTTGGMSAVEMCDSVTRAIETLPLELRKVIVLRYWQHLSYKEIAAQLHIPAGTVGRMIYDASMQLYEHLKTHAEALPAQGNAPQKTADAEDSETGNYPKEG